MIDPNIATLRLQNRAMISDLLRAAGIGETTTELRRQVVATFAFGMVFAAGMEQGLDPAQVHGLVLGALEDSFSYRRNQAVTFSEALIDAVSGDERPTSKAIIHRGIEGHAQWKSGDVEALRRNVRVVLEVVEERDGGDGRDEENAGT